MNKYKRLCTAPSPICLVSWYHWYPDVDRYPNIQISWTTNHRNLQQSHVNELFAITILLLLVWRAYQATINCKGHQLTLLWPYTELFWAFESNLVDVCYSSFTLNHPRPHPLWTTPTVDCTHSPWTEEGTWWCAGWVWSSERREGSRFQTNSAFSAKYTHQ